MGRKLLDLLKEEERRLIFEARKDGNRCLQLAGDIILFGGKGGTGKTKCSRHVKRASRVRLRRRKNF